MPTVSRILAAHEDQQMCRNSQQVVEFIGRRWVSVILIAGYQGARRFSEYRRFAGGISDRILTLRLRELEQYGLIDRLVVPTMPVQISYTPTDRGLDLVRALQPLFAWGLEVAEGPPPQPVPSSRPT